MFYNIDGHIWPTRCFIEWMVILIIDVWIFSVGRMTTYIANFIWTECYYFILGKTDGLKASIVGYTLNLKIIGSVPNLKSQKMKDNYRFDPYYKSVTNGSVKFYGKSHWQITLCTAQLVSCLIGLETTVLSTCKDIIFSYWSNTKQLIWRPAIKWDFPLSREYLGESLNGWPPVWLVWVWPNK